MFIKIKVMICSLIILMYQNAVYCSDMENSSNYVSDSDSNITDDTSTVCNEKDIEKCSYYLDKFKEFEEEVENNNFNNDEKRKLLSVIEYTKKLCINWDQTNNDMEHINEFINVITNVIIKKIQSNVILRSKAQHEILINLINICNELKQDLSEILVNQENNIKNTIMW